MATQKRQDWAHIQAAAPDLARFLADMHGIFGKPAGVRVEIGGMVIESGTVALLPHEWDGYLRRPRYR